MMLLTKKAPLELTTEDSLGMKAKQSSLANNERETSKWQPLNK